MSNTDTYKGIYAMHKYWGKKPFNEISKFIEKYSEKGETVMDCFCGSGVTLIEAIKADRKAIGIDLNPIAIKLATVSLTAVNLDEINKTFKQKTQLLESYSLKFNFTSNSGILEYLTSYNESEIHIETDGTLRIGEYPTTRVEDVKDEEVVSAISVLRSKGYRHISRIDNTIRVVCKSKFRDFNSGIAYSINGEDEPKLTYLTKIEPLSEDGWYYYESDYNEWRINNR